MQNYYIPFFIALILFRFKELGKAIKIKQNILSSLLIYKVRFLFIILWYVIINLIIKELENVCTDLVKLGAPFDWVISVEVGEHIPSQYQLAYIGKKYNF